MITDPNLVIYTCIAKGTLILADFDNNDNNPNLETLVLQCLQNTPPHHSLFTHTIKHKTYTFLIHNNTDQNPFVHFAIFDEKLDKLNQIGFLNSLKDQFNELLGKKTIKGLSLRCFQGEVTGILKGLLGLSKEGPEDSNRGERSVSAPLGKGLKKKKKKRLIGENNEKENVVHVKRGGDGNLINGDLPVSVNKYSLGDGGKQMAKRIWRKHVWVVLLIDFCVCSLLFGIWLWICKGFKCINN